MRFDVVCGSVLDGGWMEQDCKRVLIELHVSLINLDTMEPYETNGNEMKWMFEVGSSVGRSLVFLSDVTNDCCVHISVQRR